MAVMAPQKKKAKPSQKKRLQLKRAAEKPKPIKHAEPRPEGQGQSRTAQRRRMRHAYRQIKEELEDAGLRAEWLRVKTNALKDPMDMDDSIQTQTPPSAQPPRLATPPASTPARSSPHPGAPTSMPMSISSSPSHTAIRSEMRKRKRKTPETDAEKYGEYLREASRMRREMESKLTAAETEAYQRQANLHHERANVLQGETASLENLNARLQGLVEDLEEQMAALDGQHVQLQDQHRVLEQQAGTLREYNAQLQGRTLELEQKTDALQQHNTQLESRGHDLERQTGAMQEENIQLQLRNGTLQKTVDSLRNIGEQHAYETKEKEKFKTEAERLSEMIKTLQKRVKDLEASGNGKGNGKEKQNSNRCQLAGQKRYFEEKLADGLRHIQKALSKGSNDSDGKLKAWVDAFADSGEVEKEVGFLSARRIRDVAITRDDQDEREKVAAMRRKWMPVLSRGTEEELRWADEFHDEEYPDQDMLEAEAEASSQAALRSSQRGGGA